MSRLQRIRKQAMSLRGGIAVAGALAVAAGLMQTAGTLAAPELERTAKVPIASANYYPTPLPESIDCVSHGTGGSRRAEVRWTAPVSAPGEPTNYQYRVTWSLDAESPKHSFITSDTTTGRFRISDELGGFFDWGPFTAKSYRIYVQTINPDNTNVMSSGSVSSTVYTATSADTYCTTAAWYDDPNQPWENSQNWSPGVESFGIGQPLVSALNELDLGADGIDDELAVVATLDDAAAGPSKAEAPAAKSAEATTAVTSTSIQALPTSSSTAPTTAPAERSTTSSSSTSAPPSSKATSPSPSTTRASSSAAATSTAPSTARATATSTTVRATSTSTTEATTVTPVALPGGGEAKLVGGTTLVVSDDDGPVCSATVREGSTLKVRSGVLEVTDARETREVDPQTCELT